MLHLAAQSRPPGRPRRPRPPPVAQAPPAPPPRPVRPLPLPLPGSAAANLACQKMPSLANLFSVFLQLFGHGSPGNFYETGFSPHEPKPLRWPTRAPLSAESATGTISATRTTTASLSATGSPSPTGALPPSAPSPGSASAGLACFGFPRCRLFIVGDFFQSQPPGRHRQPPRQLPRRPSTNSLMGVCFWPRLGKRSQTKSDQWAHHSMNSRKN